jgi:hypothetical protein
MSRAKVPIIATALLAAALSAATKVHAQSPTLEIEGVLRGDVLVRRNAQGKIRDEASSPESFVRLSSQLSEHIRVAVALELTRTLREDGKWTEQDALDINALLREASIEIHDVGGVPVAFVVGKHEIAFGQALAAMPAYTRSPLYQTQSVNRVMGLTVRLDERIFDVIHAIEASVFSSESDSQILTHGKPGRTDSASVRIRGELFEGLQFQASAMHLGNRHLGKGSAEQRYSVGLIYQDPKGNWMAWIEGIYHADHKNPNFGSNAHFAITAGASHKVGPGLVVAEVTWIQNVLLEVGLGYRLNLSKNVSIGPEIRFTHWNDSAANGGSANDLRLALTVEVLLGPSVENSEDEVLFGKKPEEKRGHP